MTAQQQKPNSRQQTDVRKARKFLMELAWLLADYSDVNLRRVADILDRAEVGQEVDSLKGFVSENSNRNLLVGVLPGMFTDEALFATNADIAEFAKHALGVRIPRWDKKSKFELIGHIVCHTSKADDTRLRAIAQALSSVAMGDSKTKDIILSGRREQKSWNEIIDQLFRSR